MSVNPQDLPGCMSFSRHTAHPLRALISRSSHSVARRLGHLSWARRAAVPLLATALLGGSLPISSGASLVSASAPQYAVLGSSGAFAAAVALSANGADLAGTTGEIGGTLEFGAPSTALSTATIVVDVANVRSGPGIDYAPVNRLQQGQTVALLEQSTDWYRVRMPSGGTGWVSLEVLSVGSGESDTLTAKSAPAKPLLPSAVTRAAALNVRSGPSTKHSVVAKLYKGIRVEVLGRETGWYRIQTPTGVTGWVREGYVTVANEASSSTATAPATGPAAPVAAPPAAEVEPTGTVIASRANLRQGPGTTFAAITSLRGRTSLPLVARHGDWYKVRTANGTFGWVSGDLLGIDAATAKRVPITNDVPAAPRADAAPASSVANRWVWPTRGRITSRYGWRWLRGREFHNGLDIANVRWTKIVAARGGVVKQAGWCSGYGYCVIIDHGDGFVTEYGHLANRPPVRAGQSVNPGRLIGYMGSTYDRRGGGYATGVHLHFTVRSYGRTVNPLRYLP